MSATLAASLPEPPESLAVERLAVILAASVGHYWMAIDDELRSNYRIMANQALFLLGVEAHARGMARVRQSIDDMGATMRRAADKLEQMKGDEMTIARLHVGSSNCEALLMILHAVPDEADIANPIWDGEVSEEIGQLEEEEVV